MVGSLTWWEPIRLWDVCHSSRALVAREFLSSMIFGKGHLDNTDRKEIYQSTECSAQKVQAQVNTLLVIRIRRFLSWFFDALPHFKTGSELGKRDYGFYPVGYFCNYIAFIHGYL